MINVTLSPGESSREYPKIRTILQLLQELHLHVNDALIIRDGELLTPDRCVRDGDRITVRLVASRG